MPRKSRKRTRRKRGGDDDCNWIAHTICGDIKKFEPNININNYATRSVKESFPCTLVVDDAGKAILKKDEYNRTDKYGNIKMHEQYVDPTGEPCLGKTYMSRVPKRNIDDCKRDKHGYGSSKVFKDCHNVKKYGGMNVGGKFAKRTYLDSFDATVSGNFGRSDSGLVGGRWLYSFKSRKKKRKRTKKKSKRRKKKTRKRRR